jgi:hypothetical protein
MTKLDDITLTHYSTPGPMTDLADDPAEVFEGLPDEPRALCRTVQGLIVHEFWAQAYGYDVPEDRLSDLQTRSVAEMTDRILRLNPAPLAVARPVEQRMVGNCRYFTTLSCALLRRAGIPARARCGFADYFEPARFVDHWITEYWDRTEGRWVRIDAQLDAVQRAAIAPGFNTEDQPEGRFLPAGEAWLRCRQGKADPGAFGILDMWGLWFVHNNVVRDLASLNKMELLPWDMWGPMTVMTDPDAAALDRTDSIANVLTGDDTDAIRSMYEGSDDLRVPDKVFDARFGVVHSLE